MAAQVFNAIGKLGIGLAIGASVVNSALYNGKKDSIDVSTMHCIDCIIYRSRSGRRHSSGHF